MMFENTSSSCDLLVLSPHPDDAEIGLGGTLKLLSDKGRNCWVVDLTAGELGSNANAATRWHEACLSAKVLGIKGRACLALPDGFINRADANQVSQIAHVIRCLKPRWVITAPDAVRHPDHVETPHLVTKACFMAGLINYSTSCENVKLWEGGDNFPEPANRWKIQTLGRVCAEAEKPSLLFDVSSTWDLKKESLACYSSQFTRSDGSIDTAINDPAFMERISQRAQRWGRLAGTLYCEAISTAAVPLHEDLPEVIWQ